MAREKKHHEEEQQGDGFPAPEEGLVALKAPEDSGAAVSFGGEVYEIEDGFVQVPPAAASELVYHGFQRRPKK